MRSRECVSVRAPCASRARFQTFSPYACSVRYDSPRSVRDVTRRRVRAGGGVRAQIKECADTRARCDTPCVRGGVRASRSRYRLRDYVSRNTR